MTIPKPRNYYTQPQFIDVNGLGTAFRRKGSGEPVLFLHGAGSTRMWLPMYERFSKSVDFIAPEHPGFGETPRPDWLENFNDLVIHYDQFLAELEIEDVHLVGWSLGGWTAAEFASYYPRRLKSLTLIVPIGLRLVDNPASIFSNCCLKNWLTCCSMIKPRWNWWRPTRMILKRYARPIMKLPPSPN